MGCLMLFDLLLCKKLLLTLSLSLVLTRVTFMPFHWYKITLLYTIYMIIHDCPVYNVNMIIYDMIMFPNSNICISPEATDTIVVALEVDEAHQEMQR